MKGLLDPYKEWIVGHSGWDNAADLAHNIDGGTRPRRFIIIDYRRASFLSDTERL